MTGISRSKKTYSAEDQQAFLNGEAVYGPLEVSHGLPFGMGPAVRRPCIFSLHALTVSQSFDLLSLLTGLQCNWKADCVENAIVLYRSIHRLFGSWKLYLEWNQDGQVKYFLSIH